MLNQNIAPSLRQSMINEALNYHQNMNSVVFRREPHSIQVYNNPSGKTDPSQNDIIVEGNIRSRITEIQSAITKLNQTLVYASSGEVAPVFGGGALSPSGGVKPPTPGRTVTPSRFPKLPPGPVKVVQPPPTPSPNPFSQPLPRVEIPTGHVVPGTVPSEPTGPLPVIESDIERRQEENFYGSEDFESEEGNDPEGVEERKEGREEGSDEPIAPGPVTVHAPSATPAASHKTRMIIDNSLAGILSSYNALIDFIELQSRQKLLSSKDSQIISGLLKELIPPLKTTIISAQKTVKKGQPDTQVDYTRIYNVVSGIIEKISGSPPFLKADPQLLSESLPIRKDIINAIGFDAQKGKNHIYFENLLDRLKDEELKLFKFHPKSQLEKQAREDKLASIRADYTTLTQAGYNPSAKVLLAIEDRITKEVGETKKVLDYTEADIVAADKLTRKFEKHSRKFEARIAEVEAELADKARELELARESDELNTSDIESEYNDIKYNLEDLNDELMLLRSGYEQESDYYKPKGKFTIEKARPAYEKAKQGYRDYEQAYHGRVPVDSATRDQQKVLFHKPNIEREQAKEAARTEKYSKLKKAPTSIFGQGKQPKVRRGSKPIGGGKDPFGDQNELEPYLTKYLRPSKHRRNVQPIESSSDESSDGTEDEAHQINKPNGGMPIGGSKILNSPSGGGGKLARKQKEDYDIILSQPKAEAGILIEKKRGRGRPTKATLSESQAIKPAHTTAKSQDYWFM